jgi:hypothetical protein
MLNIRVGSGAVENESRYSSGPTKIIRLPTVPAPAPQHCFKPDLLKCMHTEQLSEVTVYQAHTFSEAPV